MNTNAPVSAPFTLKDKLTFWTTMVVSLGTPAICIIHDLIAMDGTWSKIGWFGWYMIAMLGLFIAFIILQPIVVTTVALWRRHGPSIFLAAVGWGTIGIWAGIMAGLYTFGFLDKLMDSWGGLGHLLLSAPFLWVSMQCFIRLGTETGKWCASKHKPREKLSATLPHPRF